VTYTIYDQLKFWLPIVTALGIVIKGYLTVKNNVSSWADQLLHNHMHHIEEAVKSNADEAMKTNALLTAAAERETSVGMKVDMVQATIHERSTQEAAVWKDVIEALTILKERTK
jgi:hypothetical protein